MASDLNSASYDQAVKYAETYFADDFRNLPPLSTIHIETITTNASHTDQFPAKIYRIYLGHSKHTVSGVTARQSIWFDFAHLPQAVGCIMYKSCKGYSDDRLERAKAEWYGPFACIVASEHRHRDLCLVLSLYYIMLSGHAANCVVSLGKSKTGFLGTFKEVCSLMSAAKPVSKPVQTAAKSREEMSISKVQSEQMAPRGGLPQFDPSGYGSISVTPAKRHLSEPRSEDGGAPMTLSQVGFKKPQKKIKPALSPSLLQAESDDQAIKSIQQSLQNGRLAEVELAEGRIRAATMAAQLDALQAENNAFKTAIEQLSTEKQFSELKTAEAMRSHEQVVAELNTARTATKDLETRIAAITSERANFSRELTTLTTENGRLMTENAALKIHIANLPIAQLESDKSSLQAKNRNLDEQVEKLEKALEDSVRGFEAYKKRVVALGNEK